MYRTLQQAFTDLKLQQTGKDSPPLDVGDLHDGQQQNSEAQLPKVFISKWIDYSNKYGLGYQLTNGCIGVYFNDSTSIIVAADEVHFEYLFWENGSDRTTMHRKLYTIDSYPTELQKKVILMKHFRGYMQENLYKPPMYSFTDLERTTNLDYLTKYLRTKYAVVFRLSNRVVQINFFDHSKLVLSSEAEIVTYIDRDKNVRTMYLGEFMREKNSEIVSRLKYAKNVLEQLLIKKQKKLAEAVGTSNGDDVVVSSPAIMKLGSSIVDSPGTPRH